MKTEAGSLGRRSGQDSGEDRLGHVEPWRGDVLWQEGRGGRQEASGRPGARSHAEMGPRRRSRFGGDAEASLGHGGSEGPGVT